MADGGPSAAPPDSADLAFGHSAARLSRDANAVNADDEASSSGAGSDLSPARRQSRRERRLSNQAEADRVQFIQNRQEAAQEAALQVRPVYFTTVCLGFIIITIATYFEVRSVYVLIITYGIECDQPLWRWLCGHIIFGMLREFCISHLKNVFLVAHVVWTFCGFFWFSAARTCKDSNPELFQWVEIVLIVAAVFLAASTLLPLLLYVVIMVLVALVNRGVISNQKAAREGTLERLEVVTYVDGMFAPEDAIDDSRPSGECCCCTEMFCAEYTVVKTPCAHYYHKDCLGDWLKLAKTCPLCRCDLEEAVWSSPQPQMEERSLSRSILTDAIQHP